MKPDYKITRNKFFDTAERNAIMRTSEERAIVDNAKGRMTWPVRYMLVHLAMNSGLRVSEIAALTIADVRLNSKPPMLYVRSGKGDRDRDVYIDRELAKHLREFVSDKRLWNQPTGDNDPLFSGQGNKPFTTTALYLSFKLAIREAGLREDLTIHSARHSYATLLLHKTNKLKYVQKQLGHSSIDMTALYAGILPEENGILADMILDA